MGNFVGNINNGQENLCVTAARGHLFVPGEDSGGKSWRLTRRGKIVAGISIALLVAAILTAIVLLSIDWSQLPKYEKLNAMLGSSKADVEDKLPDKVRYAGASFEISPLYDNDIFVGFQYETTFRSEPTAAAEVSLKTIKYLHQMFGEPLVSAQEISQKELAKQFRGDDAYYMTYTWDMNLLTKTPNGYVARQDSPEAGNCLYMDLKISYHPSADDVHIEMIFALGQEQSETVVH